MPRPAYIDNLNKPSIPRIEIRKPAVVSQPQTYKAIYRGVNLITEAIRPTLGPLPRLIMMAGLRREDLPEFLDDGATIARRIVMITPRSCDAGAMLLRGSLWKMHEEVGDGTATMAVMYHTILREGIRYVTEFGCNAMLLRSGLEKGLKAVKAALHQQAVPLKGKQAISLIARGMCQGDNEMAEMLGEIFDFVGPEGLIVVEGHHRLNLEREYIEGTYWKLSGYFSSHFSHDPIKKQVIFEDAPLLISDFKIKDPSTLIPVLEKCIKAGLKKLVIVAGDLTDSVIGLLINNNQAKTIETVAVRIPKVLEMDQVASAEDIAIMTGGKPFFQAAYPSFDEFKVEDLGYARRAWATESMFGIYGGKGDPRKIRQRMVEVKGALAQAELESEKIHQQSRLGRLHGGTAILRVGAIHQVEIDRRKEVAERAVNGLRHALVGGVVPGGGAALVAARAALADLPAANDDEAFAFRILSRAMEEPMRTIADNAGYIGDVVMDRVKSSPSGYGLDALSGQIVDMRQAGIQDSVVILEKALDIAVSGAAMTLTTDVIIHHKQPKELVEPN
jgi:chaperonin GroEL